MWSARSTRPRPAPHTRSEAVKTRTLDESAVAAGTVLLTARELAPRIGLTASKRGAEMVRNRAKLKLLPCYMPNKRTFLFHWPSVVEAVNRRTAR